MSDRLLEVIRGVDLGEIRDPLSDWQYQAIHDAIVRSYPELEWPCRDERNTHNKSVLYCQIHSNSWYHDMACQDCGARREEGK